MLHLNHYLYSFGNICICASEYCFVYLIAIKLQLKYIHIVIRIAIMKYANCIFNNNYIEKIRNTRG